MVLCLLQASGAMAFIMPSSHRVVVGPTATTTRTWTASSPMMKVTSTQLQERQWNFNEGQGPFGMKKNAEIWNGRVAQVG